MKIFLISRLLRIHVEEMKKVEILIKCIFLLLSFSMVESQTEMTGRWGKKVNAKGGGSVKETLQGNSSFKSAKQTKFGNGIAYYNVFPSDRLSKSKVVDFPLSIF